MKVLIASSRFPWPPYTGDRLRAQIWIESLLPVAEVTLVSPPGSPPPMPSTFRHIAAARGGFSRAAMRTLAQKLPMHALVSAGFRWEESLVRATGEHGPFDVAVVLLSRFHPWVARGITAPRTILDAIDSLALSVEERANEARGPLRAFWRREVKRTRELEDRVSTLYDRITVVNESERPLFGDRAVAIPNGVTIEPLDEGVRDFHFGFWGRLAYFANRDAARLLTDEVWPELHRLERSARLLIAGADAPREIREQDGKDDIRVVSPMENRSALLRRISIALFPVRYGTGQSNKLLEAAEAGCVIVATPAALRGLEHLAPAAVVEPDISRFAEAASRLLRDPARLASMRAAGRAAVERHYSREATAERLRKLIAEGVGRQ